MKFSLWLAVCITERKRYSLSRSCMHTYIKERMERIEKVATKKHPWASSRWSIHTLSTAYYSPSIRLHEARCLSSATNYIPSIHGRSPNNNAAAALDQPLAKPIPPPAEQLKGALSLALFLYSPLRKLTWTTSSRTTWALVSSCLLALCDGACTS